MLAPVLDYFLRQPLEGSPPCLLKIKRSIIVPGAVVFCSFSGVVGEKKGVVPQIARAWEWPVSVGPIGKTNLHPTSVDTVWSCLLMLSRTIWYLYCSCSKHLWLRSISRSRIARRSNNSSRRSFGLMSRSSVSVSPSSVSRTNANTLFRSQASCSSSRPGILIFWLSLATRKSFVYFNPSGPERGPPWWRNANHISVVWQNFCRGFARKWTPTWLCFQ